MVTPTMNSRIFLNRSAPHGAHMRQSRRLQDLLIPGCGFLFCVFISWGLPAPAKIVGGVWFLLGIVYLAVLTQGFRNKPGEIRFEE
jgi:putrescine importer